MLFRSVEREKKSKEGKSERLVVDNEEHREMKKPLENTGKVTNWFAGYNMHLCVFCDHVVRL